jgi:peptidoglycan/xylan/chitin deacetylase (PgdA/CDA1 family)
MRQATAALLAMGLALAATGCRPATRAAPSANASSDQRFTYAHGAVTRGPRDRKQLALIFTGGQYGEGASTILDALRERQIKASFFVTGDFIRNPEHQLYLRRMVAEGHYLGPHSDAHLLYCSWEDRNKTLVNEAAFRADLDKNLADLSRYGRTREQMRFFIPPYEWYNRQIADWSREMGLLLFNFTPGTRSNTDYMPDADPRFVPSRRIVESILEYESTHPDGLNGFFLLLHLGAGPDRTDKMHPHVPALIDELTHRGYTFARVDKLLAGARRVGGVSDADHARPGIPSGPPVFAESLPHGPRSVGSALADQTPLSLLPRSLTPSG